MACCAFIILPLWQLAINHKEFPNSELLDYGMLIFPSSTMSNYLGSAWGVYDKWRLTNEDFQVSHLKAINNNLTTRVSKATGQYRDVYVVNTEKLNVQRLWWCWHMSKVLVIIINVPEMQAKRRWSEQKRQVQTEIFLQRPIGLKGSSDKAS